MRTIAATCVFCAALLTADSSHAKPTSNAGASKHFPLAEIGAVPASTTLTVERLPIPAGFGSLSLQINALERTVQLQGRQNMKTLAAKLQTFTGTLCPKIETAPGAVLIRCRSSRIDAALVSAPGQTYLDIRELRGIPMRASDEGPPRFFYDPGHLIGFGGACPGTTPAGQGECLLHQGRNSAATQLFKAALETANRDMAALRLGDLALEAGDPNQAVSWYRKAGESGVWGRMGVSRMCEMLGPCFVDTDHFTFAFEPIGLPEPVRTEIEIRRARALAFTGKSEEAAHQLKSRLEATRLDSKPRDPVCEPGSATERICRRLTLAALRDPKNLRKVEALQLLFMLPGRESGPMADELAQAAADVFSSDPEMAVLVLRQRMELDVPDVICTPTSILCRILALAALRSPVQAGREPALTLYVSLPERKKGALAPELSQAAAEVSNRLGAPRFGANLMAVTTAQVPATKLDDHLLRMAEFYVAGRDLSHAEAIFDYARAKNTVKKAHIARWNAVERAIGGTPPLATTSSSSSPTDTDLSKAMDAVSRAQALFSGELKNDRP